MTEPRIYTAEEAEALLEKVAPGRWHVAEIDLGSHIDVCITGEREHDLITGELLCASDGEAALLAAAPDLAASVAHHARRADEAERQRDHLAAMLVRRTRDAACWRFMTENGVPNDTEAAMAVWWRDSADRDALVQMLGAEAVERAEASRG